VTYRLNEWSSQQWNDTLESLDSGDQLLWKLTKRVMKVPTLSSPLQVSEGLALSDEKQAEALADRREPQFQPSDPAVTEMVNEAMCAYENASTSEPKLTSPSEVLQAIRGLKVGLAPGTNDITNRALRHVHKRDTFLTKVFNAVLRSQYFPSAWENANVVSILKPGKDPTLPSAYQST
jgi:hypothetical protein